MNERVLRARWGLQNMVESLTNAAAAARPNAVQLFDHAAAEEHGSDAEDTEDTEATAAVLRTLGALEAVLDTISAAPAPAPVAAGFAAAASSPVPAEESEEEEEEEEKDVHRKEMQKQSSVRVPKMLVAARGKENVPPSNLVGNNHRINFKDLHSGGNNGGGGVGGGCGMKAESVSGAHTSARLAMTQQQRGVAKAARRQAQYAATAAAADAASAAAAAANKRFGGSKASTAEGEHDGKYRDQDAGRVRQIVLSPRQRIPAYSRNEV